jgi:hypothetical protein
LGLRQRRAPLARLHLPPVPAPGLLVHLGRRTRLPLPLAPVPSARSASRLRLNQQLPVVTCSVNNNSSSLRPPDLGRSDNPRRTRLQAPVCSAKQPPTRARSGRLRHNPPLSVCRHVILLARFSFDSGANPTTGFGTGTAGAFGQQQQQQPATGTGLFGQQPQQQQQTTGFGAFGWLSFDMLSLHELIVFIRCYEQQPSEAWRPVWYHHYPADHQCLRRRHLWSSEPAAATASTTTAAAGDWFVRPNDHHWHRLVRSNAASAAGSASTNWDRT